MNYLYIEQPECISEELIMLSAKVHPKGCMLFDFIYIALLARQDDRNEEQVNACQGLRRGGSKREVGGAIKSQQEGSLRDGNVPTPSMEPNAGPEPTTLSWRPSDRDLS